MMQRVHHTISQFLRMRFNAWLSRRIPAANEHQLTRNNIFIIPTRFGFIFILFDLLLFLLATNYQNNLIMLLSYLLASFFITAMMSSFFNLSGLKINAEQQSRGHAEQTVNFPIQLNSSQRRFALKLNFYNQKMVQLAVCPTGSIKVTVPFYGQSRGRHSPGRLKISSEYAFGLFVTWTHLEFACQAIIYPKIKPVREALTAMSAQFDHQDKSHAVVKGHEDFYELKSYRQGEPLSQIAWKQFAKGQGKLTKHYQQHQGKPCWLSLTDMPANDVETRLQLLCFLVIDYSKTAQHFGLDLGTVKIPPNTGAEHRLECLTALTDFVG